MRDDQGPPHLGDDEMPEIVEFVVEEDDDPGDSAAGEKGLEVSSSGADDPAQQKVAQLEAEVTHLRELYLRKLAEFDNFRKRTEREKIELRKTGGEDVVADLIPVLDNFERALQHPNDEAGEGFRQGVEMISRQLMDVLERKGLERFDPVGQPFNPELHDAMQRIEGADAEPGTVVVVMAKGFLYGGRLIRPALVGVAVESTDVEARTPTGEDAS
jgi:molecular chaperone GrpE